MCVIQCRLSRYTRVKGMNESHMTPLPLILRYMDQDDIPEVHALDTLAFPTAWPISTYRHEIRNENSRMFVLESHPRMPEQERPRPSILRRMFNANVPPTPAQRLVGYSGMWHVADEAHVSTIAIHPQWQGHKLGELLLWNMVRHAYALRASMVTLEVRVSNTVAQNLYRKYNFAIVGRRRGYYRDNGEDAYLMSTVKMDDDYRTWLKERGHVLSGLFEVVDHTKPRHT